MNMNPQIIVVKADKGTFMRLYTLHQLYPYSKIVLDINRNREIDARYIDLLRQKENV